MKCDIKIKSRHLPKFLIFFVCGILILLPTLSFIGAGFNPNIDLEKSFYPSPQWHFETVDEEGSTGRYTSIKLDSQGNPHISYCREDGIGYLKHAWWNETKWDIETIDTGYTVMVTSIAIDSMDHIHIAYTKKPHLNYAFFDGNSWSIETVYTGGVYGGVSIDLDSNDDPHISYHDYYGSRDTRYAYWNGTDWANQCVEKYGQAGFHSSIKIDSDDNVHIAYNHFTNNTLKYAFKNSSDSDFTIETVDSGGSNDVYYPVIDLDSNDDPHIGYFIVNVDDLRYAYKNQSGAGWNTETVISDGHVGNAHSLALDSKDQPFLIYCDKVEGDLEIAHWNGVKWTNNTIDSEGNVGYCSEIVLDSNNTPFISYCNWNLHDLKFATKIKLKNTPPDDMLFAQPYIPPEGIEDFGWYTSLDLDNFNYPHISYLDFGKKTLKYAYWDGISWNTETVDSSGNMNWETSLKLDENNHAHIAYMDYKNKNLKYAFFDGNSWILQVVDSSESVGYFISLDLDSNNYPHISYLDNSNRDLKYAYFDGDVWNIQTVDSAGDVGYYSSLVLDENNHAHISYYDDSNEDLKYTYWNGTSWGIQTIDSTGNSGYYSSIDLDSNNYPHISYIYWNNWDLKYAYWDGNSWIKESVDTQGDVRKWTSIEIDSKNLPHISYYDYSQGSLKYAFFNGSLWNKQTIDSYGSVGCFDSLELDDADNPHISYYDWGMKNLKYTFWDENSWDIQIVEEASSDDILDQQQIYCCGWSHQISNSNTISQEFKPSTKLLTRVELTVLSYGEPSGLTVSIRKDLNGDDLTSVYIPASKIPYDMSWKEFDFPDITVDVGQSYYIVTTAHGAPGYENCFYWYFGKNDPYVNGSAWKEQSGSWNILTVGGFPKVDLCFKTFGYYDTLSSDKYMLSEETGGIVNFTINAGVNNAGKTYVILGSISGTEPGFVLPGGLVLPLNWDLLTDIICQNFNSPMFKNFKGKLNAKGQATAQIDTLGPLTYGCSGNTVSFAYTLYNPFDFVSNPVNIEII